MFARPPNGYTIPTNNPFVGNTNYLPEIWDLGFRNPWRFSFDRLTGDLFIGDVGENNWEEIDFEPSGSEAETTVGISEKEIMISSTPGSDISRPYTGGCRVSTHRSCFRDRRACLSWDNSTRMFGLYFFGDFLNTFLCSRSFRLELANPVGFHAETLHQQFWRGRSRRTLSCRFRFREDLPR